MKACTGWAVLLVLGSTVWAAPMPTGQTFVDQGTYDPALKGYRTPAGFRLDIVADERTVVNPVGLTFTPQGQLVVLQWTPDRRTWRESRTTERTASGSIRTLYTSTKEAKDAVRVLTPDPKMGIFAVGRTILDDEQPTSVLVHDGWLYTAGKGMVRRWSWATIQAGEQRTAKPEIVAQGWSTPNLGLQIGRDGWLYVSAGDGDHRPVGCDGSTAPVPAAGGLWRCRPDGKSLQVVARHPSALQGSAVVDVYGHWFHAARTTAGGQLLHLTPGGDALEAATLLDSPRSVPTGLLYYDDGQLPNAYRRWFFVADRGRAAVQGIKLADQGAGFRVTHAFDLLASDDPLFRPTALATGPDGAIYIADLRSPETRESPFFGDGQLGRIYRLTWVGGPVPGEPEDEPALPRRPLDTWANPTAKALLGGDASTRDYALHALLRVGGERGEMLHRIAGDAEQTIAVRLTAFKGLDAMWDRPASELCVTHLNDPEPEVRRIACDLLGQHSTAKDTDTVAALERLLADAHPRVRRAAAWALATINAPASLDALISTYRTDDGKDPWLADGLIRAIERTGAEGLSKLLELARSGNDTHRDLAVQAFLVVRSRAASALRLELLLDPHLTLEQQVAVVRAFAQDQHEPPLSLAPLLKTFQQAKLPAEVVAAGVTLAAKAQQLEGPIARELVERLLAQEAPTLREAALDAIATAGLTTALPLARVQLAERKNPVAVRVAAAKALRHASNQEAPAWQNFLGEDEPAEVRVAVLQAWAAVDRPAARTAADGLANSKVGTLQQVALALLLEVPERATAQAERFLRDEWPRERLGQLVDGLLALPTPPTSLINRVLVHGLKARTPAASVQLRQLVLAKGDAARGRTLFLHERGLTCLQCHTLEGIGRAVGPDLTKRWDTATLEQFIASVLEPHKEIAPTLAATRLHVGKNTYVGIVTSETKEHLLLQPANGDVVRLRVADITHREKLTTSLMPAELLATRSFEQVLDVFAFLMNRAAQESLRGIVTNYRVVGLTGTFAEHTVGPNERLAQTDAFGQLHVRPTNMKGTNRVSFTLKVDAPRTVVLHIQTDGDVGVWQDGQRRYERTFAPPDSERITLELAAGVNAVSIIMDGTTLRTRLQGLDAPR